MIQIAEKKKYSPALILPIEAGFFITRSGLLLTGDMEGLGDYAKKRPAEKNPRPILYRQSLVTD